MSLKTLIAKTKKMISSKQIYIVFVLAILTLCAMIVQLYLSLTGVFFREYQRYAKVEIIPTARAAEVEQVIVPVQKVEEKKQPEVSSDEKKVITIKQYLDSKNSPLAKVSNTLAKQSNWKLIIAISYAESSYCKQIPKNSKGVPNYNCWGVGGASNMWAFGSDLDKAVVKYNSFLNTNPRKKPYSKMSFDEMNGIYCQDHKRPGNECLNWEEKLQTVYSELKALGL